MWVWRALLTVEQKCREQILKVTKSAEAHITTSSRSLYSTVQSSQSSNDRTLCFEHQGHGFDSNTKDI